MKYSVYVLIKNGSPVYVGCSVNVKTRLSHHKKNKIFDYFTIIESFDNKKEALAAERCIIKFYTLFRNVDWYNAENWVLSFERQTNPKYNSV